MRLYNTIRKLIILTREGLMKKIIVLLIICMLAVTPAFAFLYDIEILTVEQIEKLKDEELIEVFTEAKIEEQASSEFHNGAGFSSAKDYQKRKNLLRFIIRLRKEMSKRDVEADPIDEWLK